MNFRILFSVVFSSMFLVTHAQHISESGKVCDLLSTHHFMDHAREAEDDFSIPPQTNVLQLQSFEGAPLVVLLDFDGYKKYVPQLVIKTADNSNVLDLRGANVDDEYIYQTWLRVKEDFLPFNVNITTDSNVFNNTPKHNSVRVVITPDCNKLVGVCFSAGVAGVLISNTSDEPIYAWSSDFFTISTMGMSSIISHEIGHSFGLSHDGKKTGNVVQEYYAGHNGWATIMGNGGSFSDLNQWSKGEYSNATNTEDDLAILSAVYSGSSYRTDDHGDNTSKATKLIYANNGVLSNNTGIIERNTDVDYFYFKTNGGVINITASPAAISPNLDVKMSIYASSGNLISSSSPSDLLSASISTSLQAGVYYIEIDGVGKGDVNTGYSDYGSLGFYSINGSITNSVVNSSKPVILLDSPFSKSIIQAKEVYPVIIKFSVNDEDNDLSSVKLIHANQVIQPYLFEGFYYASIMPFFGEVNYSIEAKDSEGKITVFDASFTFNYSCNELYDNSQFSIKAVNSEETSFKYFPATNLLDGDLNTQWASVFFQANPPQPFRIDVDLNGVKSFNGVYLAQNRRDIAGNMIKYKVYSSNNGTAWGTPIAQGSLDPTVIENYINVSLQSARYLRLEADTPSYNRAPYTRLAELNIFKDTCSTRLSPPEIIFTSHYDGDIIPASLNTSQLIYVVINDNDGYVVYAEFEADGMRIPLVKQNGIYLCNYLPQSFGQKIFVVRAYDDNGNSKVDSIQVAFVDITTSDNYVEDKLSTAYPNPVSNGEMVVFSTPISGSIYNALGVEVGVISNASTVDLNGYPSGIYTVKTFEGAIFKLMIR